MGPTSRGFFAGGGFVPLDGCARVLIRPVIVFRPGDRLDRYRLVKELGAGGQAAVWQVEDPIEPEVRKVVKLFPTRGAPKGSLERLRREARSLASLSHPALVRCFGLFEDLQAKVLGLVLEYVEGVTLAAAMQDARWSPGLAEAALRHLAEGIAHMHGQGYVHRDLKPENVLLDGRFFEQPGEPGMVRIIDLGIAISSWDTTRLTAEGSVIGTAAYMAPEVIAPIRFKGARDAPAVDVFAFGVIAWELLVGGHPTGLGSDAFGGDFGTIYVQEAGSASWGSAQVAEPFRSVIQACLALQPASRVGDGAAVVGMLASPQMASQARASGVASLVEHVPEGALAPSALPRRVEPGAGRGLWVVGAVGLLGAGVLGGWCWSRSASRGLEEGAASALSGSGAAVEKKPEGLPAPSGSASAGPP